jgi:hypothetical protein
MKPEIGKIMTLSTSHITPSDDSKLTKDDGTTCGVVFRLDGQGSGYLIHCNEDLDPARFPNVNPRDFYRDMQQKGWSIALVDIQAYAWKHGCEYVRLDPDAEEVDELHTYTW